MDTFLYNQIEETFFIISKYKKDVRNLILSLIVVTAVILLYDFLTAITIFILISGDIIISIYNDYKSFKKCNRELLTKAGIYKAEIYIKEK